MLQVAVLRTFRDIRVLISGRLGAVIILCAVVSDLAILSKVGLQAWTDPEGSRRSRLADFKTVGT
jgi:hypothetical protein